MQGETPLQTTCSSLAGGSPLARPTSFFAGCSECVIFFVLVFYFAEAGVWADTSTVVFSVAAVSNGVFWAKQFREKGFWLIKKTFLTDCDLVL